jgi:hypothetical protein
VSTPQAAALDYPRTYHGSLAARIVALIVAVMFIGFAAVPLVLSSRGARVPAFVPLLLLVPLAIGLYALLTAFRSRLVLSADAIEVCGAFTTRRLMRAEIAGRRRIQLKNGTATVLVPRVEGQKILRFDDGQFARDPLLDTWLGSLPDLDARDRDASEAQIEANPEFGPTPEARRAWLEEAGRLATVFNVAAIAAALWALLLRDPYGIGSLVLVILPPAALYIAGRSHGLYRLSFERNDARPTLALAVLAPGFALPVHAFQDIGVLDVPRLLIYVASLTLLLAWLGLRSAPPSRATAGASSPAGPWAILVIALFGYSLGVLVLGNTWFDTTPGADYRVQVMAKDETHGRSTSYHFTLAQWGTHSGTRRVQVSSALYHAVPRDGLVCVHEGQGALRAAWYRLAACH